MNERNLRSHNQTPTTNHLAGPHVHNTSEPLIPEILSEIQIRPTVPATPRPAREPPAALCPLGPRSPPPQNPRPLRRPCAATAGVKAPRTLGRDARQERPGAHHPSHTRHNTGPPPACLLAEAGRRPDPETRLALSAGAQACPVLRGGLWASTSLHSGAAAISINSSALGRHACGGTETKTPEEKRPRSAESSRGRKKIPQNSAAAASAQAPERAAG